MSLSLPLFCLSLSAKDFPFASSSTLFSFNYPPTQSWPSAQFASLWCIFVCGAATTSSNDSNDQIGCSMLLLEVFVALVAQREQEWVKKSERVCNATDKFPSLFANRSKSVTRGWIEQLHPPSSRLRASTSLIDARREFFFFFSLHFNYVKIFSKSLSTHSTTETLRRCRTMTLFFHLFKSQFKQFFQLVVFTTTRCYLKVADLTLWHCTNALKCSESNFNGWSSPQHRQDDEDWVEKTTKKGRKKMKG